MSKRKPASKKQRLGGRKPILQVELVAAALIQLSGNITAVANRFGVARASVQEMIAKNENLQKVLASARKTMVDQVESRFYADCLKDGPQYQTSRIFFLKTQAKDRGYIEKQEIAVEGKQMVIVEEIVDGGTVEGGHGADSAPGQTP